MKIVTTPEGQDNKTVSQEQRQVRRQEQLIGQIRPKPGQRVFQYNLDTEVVTEAIIECVSIEAFGKDKHSHATNTVHKKVKTDPRCIYCVSLNLNNAKRKFDTMIARLVKDGILKKV